MTIHWIDLLLFIIYIILMLGIGLHYYKKSTSAEDYYVGGRSISPWHIGLSVVATDVGGGFSIGLGGLGFILGISGSWMLFTGIIGAWLSAVILIPRVFKLVEHHPLTTFPQVLGHLFDKRVALIAGIISFIGYLGFTSSQLLAGAKLATATFPDFSLQSSLWVMGFIAVAYTVLGGMKAVVYTDTIQWIILFSGLFFIGIPFGYHALGGWDAIVNSIPKSHLSLKNIDAIQIVNWVITIVPVWFIGMTLYQRMYACGNVKAAKKAWFIAGLFEWPFMAFLGVILGVFSRAALHQGLFSHLGINVIGDMDPEMGLPLFLANILPVGLMGIMMSAYFSAILSTADSCLMAASGNVVADLIKPFRKMPDNQELKLSRYMTLLLGLIAVLLASTMQNVLELMLMSYAFMVSGLLVPVLGGFLMPGSSSTAALAAMVTGGTTTLVLIAGNWDLPLGLDANAFGLSASAIVFLMINKLTLKRKITVINK
jgi:solute:Na+ symporter, SSS family